MRTYGPTAVANHAANAGITPARAKAILGALDTPTLNGLVAWIDDPANQGANEAAWAAAWPALQPLPLAEQRFVLATIAAIAGGVAIG